MDITLFHSIWTVAMLILFIAIWAWAWSSKRKPGFDAAARMPLDDDVHGRTNAAPGTTPGMEEVEQRREQLPRTPRAADTDIDTTRTGENNNG